MILIFSSKSWGKKNWYLLTWAAFFGVFLVAKNESYLKFMVGATINEHLTFVFFIFRASWLFSDQLFSMTRWIFNRPPAPWDLPCLGGFDVEAKDSVDMSMFLSDFQTYLMPATYLFSPCVMFNLVTQCYTMQPEWPLDWTIATATRGTSRSTWGRTQSLEQTSLRHLEMKTRLVDPKRGWKKNNIWGTDLYFFVTHRRLQVMFASLLDMLLKCCDICFLFLVQFFRPINFVQDVCEVTPMFQDWIIVISSQSSWCCTCSIKAGLEPHHCEWQGPSDSPRRGWKSKLRNRNSQLLCQKPKPTKNNKKQLTSFYSISVMVCHGWYNNLYPQKRIVIGIPLTAKINFQFPTRTSTQSQPLSDTKRTSWLVCHWAKLVNDNGRRLGKQLCTVIYIYIYFVFFWPCMLYVECKRNVIQS